MINIIIADDHEMFRKGIQKIIETAPDMRVVGEASNGCELVEKLAGLKHVDILLLDISMPGASGIDSIARVHSLCPGLPILMVSMHEEEQYAMRALKSGCKGYIIKASSTDELINAIYKVYRGGRYISLKIAEKLADYLSRDTETKPHEQLSNREYDILCLLAGGKSVTEIAGTLNLSIKTISTYKMRICKKLNCKNDAGLVRYAIENNLV